MTARVVFDLDGTLIDSVPHIHHAVSLALRELDLNPVAPEVVRGFVGRGLPPLLKDVLTYLDQRPELSQPLYDRVMAHYVSLPSDPGTIYPGVQDALTTLAGKGLSLAVCTNKPGAATTAALKDVGLARFFETVIAGDSLSTRKPDPAMLFAATGNASRVVFVGDSEVDAQTAQAAQNAVSADPKSPSIAFALYTGGYRKTPVDQIPHQGAFDHHDALVDLVTKLL